MCNYPFPTRDTPWLAKIKGVKASKQIIKLWDFPIGEKYMYYDFIILPNFSELEVFFMYVSHHHVRSICRFCRPYYYNIQYQYASWQYYFLNLKSSSKFVLCSIFFSVFIYIFIQKCTLYIKDDIKLVFRVHRILWKNLKICFLFSGPFFSIRSIGSNSSQMSTFNSQHFYVMNFRHFLEMLEFNLWHF